MATLDWSKCPAVESVPGRLSGAWVFRDTRMPVSAVFENLEAGATIEEIIEQLPVFPQAAGNNGDSGSFSKPVALRSFFGEPGKQHPDGSHVLLDRWRRGLALQRFDIRRDRDRLNVFEVLITGALSPGQELLDCPVVGSSCVRVADRDRKKREEFFPG